MFRPSTIVRFAPLALAAILAACGDTSVMTPPSATSTIAGGGATASLSGWDTLRFSFTIDPSRTTFYYLGAGNSITFPAGSLCDPSSTFGADQWDQPCAIGTAPLVINAKAWLDAAQHPRIEFDKHIRFAPSANPASWVMLSFTDYAGEWNLGGVIGYCTSASSACVNE